MLKRRRATVPGSRPVRLLAAGMLVSAIGNGLWLAGGVIFLVRSAGLEPLQVGLGLSLAGLVGVLAGIPAGMCADRVGARRVSIAMLLLEALATTFFLTVSSVPVFLLVASLAAAGMAGSNAARGAMLAAVVGVRGATRARAVLRSVSNLGISLGTLAAGLVLTLDTRAAYVGLVLTDAVTFLAAAGIYLWLPRVAPTDAGTTLARFAAVRDVRFVAVAGINAIMTINYGILTVALPLWVITSTAAPQWVVSPLFLINTVLCVALQVRASRGLESPKRAAAATRGAGLLFALGCLLFALSAGRSATVAVSLLSCAILIHTVGELRQAAGSFGLSFTLASRDIHGQYQGVWGVGTGVGQSVAPALLTTVVIGGGIWGWLAVGALLAISGALMPLVVGWTLANRPPGSATY